MKNWILISLLVVSSAASAYPTDMDGKPLFPKEMPAVCEAKGDVALTAFTYREKLPEEKMLEALERDWNETWSKDPDLVWADYVDLQRIIRDAYRTDSNGAFVRESTEQSTYNEVIGCLYEHNGW